MKIDDGAGIFKRNMMIHFQWRQHNGSDHINTKLKWRKIKTIVGETANCYIIRADYYKFMNDEFHYFFLKRIL